MPVTAAELQAPIELDLAPLDRDIAEANRRLASIGQGVRLSGVDSALASVGQSANNASAQAQASFQSIASSANVSFNQVASASQSASSAAQTAINNIAASTQQVAASASQMGGSVQQAGQQAAAGLQGITPAAQAASASISDLSKQKAQLLGHLSNVDAQVRSETKALADAQAAAGSYKAAQSAMGAEAAASQQKLAGLVQQQSLLRSELGSVNSALKTATTSHQGAAAAAASGAAATQESSNRFQGFVGVLRGGTAAAEGASGIFSRTTTQIRTMGTALQGYDQIAQGIASAMGGIPVPVAIAVTAVAALIPVLVRLLSASKDAVEINSQLVQSDIELARAFELLGQGAISASGGITHYKGAAAEMVQADLTSQLQFYSQTWEKVETATLAAREAQAKLNTTNAEFTPQIDQTRAGVERLEQQIQRLNAEGINASLVEQQHAAQMQLLMNLESQRESTTRSLSSEVNNLTAASEADRKKLEEVQGALVKQIESLGMTSYALRVAAQDAGVYEGALGSLTRAVVVSANANVRLEQAIRAVRLAQMDAGSSTLSLSEKAKELEGRILDGQRAYMDKGIPAQQAYLESLRLNGAAIDQHVKRTQEKVAMENRAAIGAKDHAKAASLLSQELKQQSGIVAEAVGYRKESTTAEKAFSDASDHARKGVSASAKAMKEYGAGIREWLQEHAKGVSLSKQLWDSWSKDTQAIISRSGKALIISQAENTRIMVENAARENTTLDILITNWRRYGEEKKKAILGTGTPIKITFPEADVDKLPKLRDLIKESISDIEHTYDEYSKSTLENLSKVEDAWHNAPTPVYTAAEQIKTALDAIEEKLNNSVTLQAANYTSGVASMMDGVVSAFEQEAERLGLSGQAAWEHVVSKTREVAGPLSSEARTAAEQQLKAYTEGITPLPGVWNKILDDIQKSTRKWSADLSKEVRGAVGDVLAVIDTMPGEIGDSLRKGQSEFEKWFNFLDASTKLIQRILGQEQTGIIGVLSDILGTSQQSSATVIATTQDMSAQAKAAAQDMSIGVQASIEEMSAGVQADVQQMHDQVVYVFDDMAAKAKAASQDMSEDIESDEGGFLSSLQGYVAKAAAIAGGIGMIFAGNQQGGVRGGITGAMGGLSAGAAIGSLFGPGPGTAIGAAIGAGVGFFAGLFGGGKSELQKAQEAAQLQQAKDALVISGQQREQAIEATKQSLLKTASDLTELFKSVAVHIDIPDEIWDAWFEDVDRAMKGLTERFKEWSAESSDDLKASAEEIQAVAGAAAAIPGALAAVNSSLGASQSQIDLVGDSWERMLTKFAAVEEMVSRKTERHARKLAEGAESIPEFAINVSEAIRAVDTIPDVSTVKFERLGEATEKIIQIESDIFTKVDRWALKVAGQGAEMGLPILEFTSTLSSLLNQAVNQKLPTEGDWRNLLEGGRAGINLAFDLFESIQADILARTSAASEQANPILDMLNSLFGVNKAAGESGSIVSIDFAALRTQAHNLLQVAIDLAAEFSSEARAAGNKIAEETKDIPSFASAIFGAIKEGSDLGEGKVNADRLLSDGKAIFDAVIALSALYSSDQLKSAIEAAQGGTTINAFAKSIGETSKALKEGSDVSAAQITTAVGNYSVIVDAINRTQQLVSAGALASAQQTSIDASRMLEAAAKTSSYIKTIGETSVVDPQPWIHSVANFTFGLQAGADWIHKGWEISVTMLSESEILRSNVIKAMENMAAAVSTTNQSAAASSFSIATPALAPTLTPTAVVPTGGVSSRTSTPQNVTIKREGDTYQITVPNLEEFIRVRDYIKQQEQKDYRASIEATMHGVVVYS